MNLQNVKRLVKAAQSGDNEAFIELIQGYEKVLYNTACRWIHNEEDIADIMQETILKAYEKIGTLREPKYFNTWICKILINECNQYFRKEHKVLDLSTLPTTHEMDTSKLELEELLKELPAKYKMPLVLFYQFGYSLQELSEMLQEPLGTIKSRIHRAKQILKDANENSNKEKGGIRNEYF